MSYATDTRSTYRLTPAQVDALDYVYGLDGAGLSPEAKAVLSERTLMSLARRGLIRLINGDPTITPLGTDVLFAYV